MTSQLLSLGGVALPRDALVDDIQAPLDFFDSSRQAHTTLWNIKILFAN
jgi:hypothetical protein